MDLSVKSVAALSAMAVGILFCSAGIGLGIKLSPEWLMVPVSLLIACAIGALIGFLNGVLVVKLKTSAFIITLASFICVRYRAGRFRRQVRAGSRTPPSGCSQ